MSLSITWRYVVSCCCFRSLCFAHNLSNGNSRFSVIVLVVQNLVSVFKEEPFHDIMFHFALEQGQIESGRGLRNSARGLFNRLRGYDASEYCCCELDRFAFWMDIALFSGWILLCIKNAMTDLWWLILAFTASVITHARQAEGSANFAFFSYELWMRTTR